MKAKNTINEYFCPRSLTNIFPFRKKNTLTLTCTILNETYINKCQTLSKHDFIKHNRSVSYHKIEHREHMYGLHSDHHIQLLWSLCFHTHTHTLRIPFTEVVKNKQHEFLSCKYSLENLILQISQHLLPQFHSLNIED